MFGWLKSLFGAEPVQEVVPPPLPLKVKKTEKLVAKKVVKKEAPKIKATKAPKKKKEVEVVSVAIQEEALVEEPKKKGRPKKAS